MGGVTPKGGSPKGRGLLQRGGHPKGGVTPRGENLGTNRGALWGSPGAPGGDDPSPSPRRHLKLRSSPVLGRVPPFSHFPPFWVPQIFFWGCSLKFRESPKSSKFGASAPEGAPIPANGRHFGVS